MKNINCEEEDYTVTWLSSFPTLQANYTLYIFKPRKWRQQFSFALPANYSFSLATTLPATSFAFSLPHLNRHAPRPSPLAISTVRLTPSPLAPSFSAAAVDYSLSLPRHAHPLSTSSNTTSLLPLLTPSPPNALQVTRSSFKKKKNLISEK